MSECVGLLGVLAKTCAERKALVAGKELGVSADIHVCEAISRCV